MIRVHVICEGSTEEMFIKEILAEYFLSQQIYLIPSLIGKPGHKGGNICYTRLLTDVSLRLKNDKQCYCTTMLDYYGLHIEFPGKKEAVKSNSILDKSKIMKKYLSAEITKKLGDMSSRFIPYIQFHEFEGLLFSAPETLANSLNCDLIHEFQKIRDKYPSPEDINDNIETAPSKRISSLHPSYDKPYHPIMVALDIGLDLMREECKIFNSWILSLEALN
ncbi:Uncharacterised protein [Legionella wadsworthii]|uniref:DUF4276 family protein n=1 Tax=Legionella wadsworthii TaxID=28088 RepID=A0A378LRL3_9GAMM|nr:DUF4276 family protein [Legionella wadsworthii]STY28478.1 Uncharacterised protein [Legionella wadsworthii]